eukprot:scaffold15942_cov74-Skeletonema_marinoi.AAC.2
MSYVVVGCLRLYGRWSVAVLCCVCGHDDGRRALQCPMLRVLSLFFYGSHGPTNVNAMSLSRRVLSLAS